MSHPHTVIFHFPPESPLTSADIEDDIAEALGNAMDNKNADHYVDGNEIGESIDIFVWSRDPHAALELCRPMLAQKRLLHTVVVVYGPNGSGPFTVIYPPDFQGDFSL